MNPCNAIVMAASFSLLSMPVFAVSPDHGPGIPRGPGKRDVVAISSADAVEKARALDGAFVEFEGEAIGEPMERGDHAWMNLSDGNAAIGAWIRGDDIPGAISFGSYRKTGDWIRVRGIFHRACAEHGGDLDIHVTEAAVSRRGSTSFHPPDRTRLAAALILLAVSAALYPLWRSRERSALRSRGSGVHAMIKDGGRTEKGGRAG